MIGVSFFFRFVILGAAPGYVLPKFPNYLHAFPKSLCQSIIVIDNKKVFQLFLNSSFTETISYFKKRLP